MPHRVSLRAAALLREGGQRSVITLFPPGVDQRRVQTLAPQQCALVGPTQALDSLRTRILYDAL